MVDPASFFGLSGAIGAASKATSWLEYATKYKGERIQVRSHRIEEIDTGKRAAKVHFYAYVIEGTIEEVVSFPPGFHLSDVEESIEQSLRDFSRQKHKLEDMDDHWEYNPAEQGVRSTDKKFISFRDIDQLEFPAQDEPEE